MENKDYFKMTFDEQVAESMRYRIDNEIEWYRKYDETGKCISVEIPAEQLLFMRQQAREERRARSMG